ncbi:MAG: hypothetical protein F6K32_11235 [Desertifilum sp. SIO1I2]|nr:hypothetical protein [Desertifilum sp. SIO1I2]
MSQSIHRLELSAPPQFEKSLGYSGNRRWVSWHWEPDVEQLVYQDDKQIGSASNAAWQVFLGHSQMQPQLAEYQLDRRDRHWLLLDRTTRNLYVGEGSIIQSLLEQPEGLALLASLDSPSTLAKPQSPTIRHLVNAAIIGATASAIAALGFVSWSTFKPAPQSVTPPSEPILSNKPGTAPAMIPAGTCGAGGSGDLTQFIAQTNGASELNVLAVYEARSDHSANNRQTGVVQVNVERQNRPMILAFSSYEPVEWQLNLAPNVQIEKIILNGYHDQNIVGAENIPVEEYSYEGTGNSFGEFPHNWDGNLTNAPMVTQLQAMTGRNVTSFQGCYRGTEFTLR